MRNRTSTYDRMTPATERRPVSSRIAEAAGWATTRQTQISGLTWERNDFGGLDARRANGTVRLADDDGTTTVYAFTTNLVLRWKATVDAGAPTRAIINLARIALDEAR